MAYNQTFVDRRAVDLTLDGKQRVDTFDGFDGDRRLPEPRQVEELAPCMRPARRLDDRPSLATRFIEPVEARIGVRLHQAGEAGQVKLRMLAATVTRVEERRSRRIAPAKGLIVPHIGPQTSGPRLALGQHRHGDVIGVDASD